MIYVRGITVLLLILTMLYIAERNWPERVGQSVQSQRAQALQEVGDEPGPTRPAESLPEFRLD